MLGLVQTWPDLPICDTHHTAARRTARQLQPAEVDELERAHRSGTKLRDLATLAGVSTQTISQHLRARGLNTRRGLAPEDVPAAAELYRSGWSLARIAEKFDTTANTVRRRLLEVGVRMRDTQGRERRAILKPS
jgi:lambda repressor-like predicted transcriptional regulator